MKSRLPILGLLTFAVACNSVEKVGLPAPERDALRQRVLVDCVAKGAGRVQSFKSRSSAAWGLSTDWQRHDSYEHKYTKTGNTSPETTNLIRVWKSTSDNVYLFVTSTTSGTERRYFVRLPRAAGQPGSNEDLIDDLQTHACFPLDSDDDEDYVELNGAQEGPAVSKKHYVTVNPNDSTSKKYVETYTFNFMYPAYIGMLQKQVNITNRDRNGRPTGTNEEYKSTFAAIAGQDNLLVDYTNPIFYNPGESTPRYCEIVVPAVDNTYPSFPVEYKLPFAIPTDLNACANAVPVSWTDFPI